jgi:hypothetical protein
MNLIYDIFENEIDKPTAELADIYADIIKNIDEFKFAYAKIITDKFGIIPQEEIEGRLKELNDYTLTKEFKDNLIVEQIKVLSDMLYNTIKGINTITNAPNLTDDILFQYICLKHPNIKYSKKTYDDVIIKALDL